MTQKVQNNKSPLQSLLERLEAVVPSLSRLVDDLINDAKLHLMSGNLFHARFNIEQAIDSLSAGSSNKKNLLRPWKSQNKLRQDVKLKS